jgi:hypothetical protein
MVKWKEVSTGDILVAVLALVGAISIPIIVIVNFLAVSFNTVNAGSHAGWRPCMTINFVLTDDAPVEVRDAFATAGNAWNTAGSPVLFTTTVLEGNNDVVPYGTIPVLLTEDDSEQLNDMALAATYITANSATGRAVSGYIILSDRVILDPSLPKVVEHELGYVLGLSHATSGLMRPMIDRDSTVTLENVNEASRFTSPCLS